MNAFIDRYQILSEIGRGGMAVVYRAFDPQNQRQVALKMLPREYLHEPQFRARFQREIEILTKFRHPGIVHIYGFGQFHGQPYLVMQYMPGGSLEDRLKRKGTFTLAEATALLERLAPALEAAHAQNIVHRDLKPNNILFDEHKQPYIADFGIARLAEHGGQTKLTGSLLIGTPAYMSPEQAKSGEVDARSDVYALGVLTYELLTGKLPFDADTPMKLALKHIMDPIPDILSANPSLPNRLKKIIPKALAKTPKDRYTTPTEFVNALKEATQQKTTPAYLTPPPGLLQKAALPSVSFLAWLTPGRIAGIGGALLIVFALWSIFRLNSDSLPAPSLLSSTPSPIFLSQTPSPPPSTATPQPIVLVEAQAGITLHNDQPFRKNEELSASTEALEMLVYDRADFEPGYLYAAPNSLVRFDDVSERGFQLSITAGSKIFVETGAYPFAEIQPAHVPSLTLRVEGSCMAVDATQGDTLLVSCYEGICSYEVFGGGEGEIPAGMQILLDIPTLTLLAEASIPQTEAQSYFEAVQTNAAALACVSLYIPISSLLPSPTLPPTPKPGFATWTPTPLPSKTPEPSNTATLPPGITPSTTPSPTIMPTKTSSPTDPTNQPEITLTTTPTPSKTPTLPPVLTPTPSKTPIPIIVSPSETSPPATSTKTPVPPTTTRTPTPTKTPYPTYTPSPTDTIYPTDTPEPTNTFTPSIP